MTKRIDITEDVEFTWPDDELLPITKCKCGEKFGLWDFFIGFYDEDPYVCPSCQRKLVFANNVHVYVVVEDDQTD